MSYEIVKLFQNYEIYVKVKTKKDYQSYFEKFKEENAVALTDVLADIDDQKPLAEVAKSFAEDAFAVFEKRGKVKQARLVTINYHLIFYVFPYLLKEREADGKAICDALRDAWNERFGCSIDYADYETIEGGFIVKFFGIPINSIGFGKKD